MQPQTFRQLTIWTIITNMLIIVGAGNGLFIVIYELTLPFHPEEQLALSLNNFFDDLLPAAAVFSLSAQIFLFFSIFFKTGLKLFFTFLGLTFAVAGLIYLGVNLGRDSDATWALVSAIPFTTLSIILFYKLVTYNIRVMAAVEEV